MIDTAGDLVNYINKLVNDAKERPGIIDEDSDIRIKVGHVLLRIKGLSVSSVDNMVIIEMNYERT
jgi:hypothetical protein